MFVSMTACLAWLRRLSRAWLLLAVSATLGAAEPQLRLVEQPGGAYVTDSIHVAASSASGLSVLRRAGQTTLLGPGQAVHFSGGTVVLLSAVDRATEVALFDAAGRPLREVRIPQDVKTLAFGESLATFASVPHDPGLPYAVEVLSPAGSTTLERPGRTIAGFTALERHLVIDSIENRKTAPLLSDVIDETGHVAWSFRAPDRALPRIVALDTTAAALYPGRPDSLLRIATEEAPQPRERVLHGAVLTDVAFVTGTEWVFVWGAHDAALVDREHLDVVWQVHLGGKARQLTSVTSSVTRTAGTLVTLTRTETPTGTWQVDAVFLNAADGTVAGRSRLYESRAVPTHVKRFRRGERERLVLPDRVYEVSASPERQP